jgi:hypothetical protein
MTDLHVPYEEREQVKVLGARWDAQRRCWVVPPGVDLAPFDPWRAPRPVPAPPVVDLDLVLDHPALVSAATACWSCRAPITVVCIAEFDTDGDLSAVTGVRAMDKTLRAALQGHPHYRHCYYRGGWVYLNLCPACEAVQGDFYVTVLPLAGPGGSQTDSAVTPERGSPARGRLRTLAASPRPRAMQPRHSPSGLQYHAPR